MVKKIKMSDDNFKIEVLRLLNKISDQLDGKIFVITPKQSKKKSINKMSDKGFKAMCINNLVKTLGPNILNYIKQ